ncbi:MAG: hypothetical protein Q9195_006285 [Heterodermia aff. obscurata]
MMLMADPHSCKSTLRMDGAEIDDLLKTRVQQSHSSTLLSTFSEIVKGPRSLRQLWRGTTPSVIRTGLGSALYFSILDGLRHHVARSNLPPVAVVVEALKRREEHPSSSVPKSSNLANLTSGAIARVSAGFIMTPVTVIKVRYESSLYSYKSIMNAASSISSTEGIRGFFSGFGATALRDAPYAGLYVLFYEQSKSRLSKLQKPSFVEEVSTANSDMSGGVAAAVNFGSGVVAACLAATITNPFDAMKTRMQLLPERYRTMVKAGPRMVREGGLASLFDGLGLRIGRKAISSALTWTLYEELVRRAGIRWQNKDSES